MSDIYWPRIDTISSDNHKRLCELAISKKIPVEELLEFVRQCALVSNAHIDIIADDMICVLEYEPERGEVLEVKLTIAKLKPLHQIVNEDEWTVGQIEAFHRAWEMYKKTLNY
jgi:hypothetical protein